MTTLDARKGDTDEWEMALLFAERLYMLIGKCLENIRSRPHDAEEALKLEVLLRRAKNLLDRTRAMAASGGRKKVSTKTRWIRRKMAGLRFLSDMREMHKKRGLLAPSS